MITILHGDNFVASRQHLNQTIKKHKSNKTEIARFDGRNLKPEALTQALESASLFGQDQFIVIEDFLCQPHSNQKSQLTDIILKNSAKTIILWEKKPISALVKKQFPQAAIKEFKTPRIVFKFLDSIKPNHSQTSLQLLHQCYQKDAPALVFYLFSRRLTQLIQVLDAPESLKTAPWQTNKLKTQAKNFTLNKLTQLHRQLLDIDYQIKTGQTDLPLAAHLDLLLAKL